MTDIARPKPKLLVNHENFKRLNEKQPGESVTWMVYGPAKTGKTMFMGTAGDRTLFINNGSGDATLQSPLFREKYGFNPIVVDIHEVVGSNGLPIGLPQAFDAMTDAIDYGLEHFGDQIDTIAVDDSTATGRYAMYKGLTINDATGKSKTLVDVVKKFDVMDAAVQDYKVEMSLVFQFLIGTIEIAQQAGKHLIVGAHERHTYAEPTKIMGEKVLKHIRPGFTGQTMPSAIGGLWDVLTHSEAVGGGSNTVYRQRFNGDEMIEAGVRYGGIFETVESNVNFLKAVERIKAAQVNTKAMPRR